MSRTDEIAVRRLGPADRPLAQQTFALMAAVFGEGSDALSDQYVDGLLARSDFWALVALDGAAPVGDITAHVLPMTHNEPPRPVVMARGGNARELIDTARVPARRTVLYWSFERRSAFLLVFTVILFFSR